MKVFKVVFVLLATAFIAAVVYFGIQDGSFTAEVSQNIAVPAAVLFDEVNELKSHENWNAHLQGENITLYYPENTRGEEAYLKWEGKNYKGSMTIIKSRPYSSIVQQINFDEQSDASGIQYSWSFEPIDNDASTKVTVTAEGALGLFERMYASIKGTSTEEQLKQTLTQSLNNLSGIVIQKTEKYVINVHGVREYSGGFYLYVNAVLRTTDIAQAIDEKAQQLHRFFETNGIRADGALFVLYHEWNLLTKEAVISVALPTKERITTPDQSDVQSGFLPTQRVLKTSLKGDYTNLQEAWNEAESYIQENGLTKNDETIPFEVYTINQATTKNPAEWLTDIYIPLAQ